MITRNIQEVLAQISGSRIVRLRTKTQVKMNVKSRVDGTPNPYKKGVSKIAARNCIIGADYSNAVNNQLAREDKVGDFQPEKLWKGKGRRVSKFMVEHSETLEQYLAILPKTDGENNNITESVYIDNDSGLEIDVKTLKDFLPPYKESDNQGTEKAVHWQVIKLENIIGLKSGEFEYVA